MRPSRRPASFSRWSSGLAAATLGDDDDGPRHRRQHAPLLLHQVQFRSDPTLGLGARLWGGDEVAAARRQTTSDHQGWMVPARRHTPRGGCHRQLHGCAI
ncbi:hypothetical protein GMORB2_1722 [Geosmithia morbida]|uniref:Uncharacterized protein n=1 Tax=Geosmithia morbida TaxID=1094350 RepID=A0A9P4YU67_9HYPO|nr:uncharacterized protein GMORB2_1722 [Geosmithia morbida]KAF4121882.1 hypothetical protein GMORB2_1722 [Geosmithia morbida]